MVEPWESTNLQRLVVCDIDNTLISVDKYLEPELPRLVQEARQQGIGFTLATGRVFAASVKYAKLLDLDLPLITNSGAFISDVTGERIYRYLQLPRETTLQLLDATDHLPALRYLHVGGRIFAEHSTYESERYSQILEVPFEYVGDLRQWFAEVQRAPAAFVVRFGRDEQGHAAAAEFSHQSAREYNGVLTVLRTLPHLVEFLHPEASKGKALEVVADMLNVPIARTYALGDAEGDLDMVRAAGVGILVANAPADLHRLADRVTTSPSGQGVVQILHELINE